MNARTSRFVWIAGGLLFLLIFNGGMRTSGLAAFGMLLVAFAALARVPSSGGASSLERRLLAFGLFFAACAALSFSPRVAAHQMMILAAGLVAFRVTSRAFTRKNARSGLLALFVACTLYLAAAFAHYVLIGETTLHFAKFGAKFVFTMGHYNHMGTLLLFLVPLPALLISRRPVSFMITAALLLLVFLTGSRGAAGAAVASFLLLALTERSGARRRLSPALLIASVLALFLAACLVNPEIRAKFTTRLFDLRTADGRGRDVIWKGAISLAAVRPLFGIGPGHYPLLSPPVTHAQLLDAHNLFLNLLCEVGIPGLLLFLFVLCAAFRAPPSGEGDPELSRAVRIALFCVLAQNLFASTLLLSGASALLFFLFLGLLDASRRFAPLSISMSRILPLPAALLLLVAFVVPGSRLFVAELATQEGLLAAAAFDLPRAEARFRAALAADPAHAVVRLNHGLILARLHRDREAASEFAVASAGLPNGPLVLGARLYLLDKAYRNGEQDTAQNDSIAAKGQALRSRLRTVERTGYADLAEASSLYAIGSPPDLDRILPLLARALYENPRTIWSGFALERLADGVFLDRFLPVLDLFRVAEEAPYPHHLADALAFAGRLTEAVEIYSRAPLTARAFAEGIRDEDRRGGPSGVAKRLFELIAASGPCGGSHRGYFIAALRVRRDGGTLEAGILPEPRSAEDHLRGALFELIRTGDEKIAAHLLAEAWRIHARDFPAPVHFAYVTPLVPAPRLLPTAVAPEVPAWLDDNFLYFTTRVEPLPALACAVRAGGPFSSDLIHRFARSCKEARRIVQCEGILASP